MNRLLLFILQFGLGGLALASPGSPFIRRFRPEDIGAAPQFFGLTVSAAGLVYAGGQGGLMEFDGQEWRNLAAGKGYLAGIASDGRGRIYVGGIAKILCFEPTVKGDWASRDILAPLGLSPTGASPFFFAEEDPRDQSLWFSAINRLVRVDQSGQASVIRQEGITRLIPWAGRLLLAKSGAGASLGWADRGKIDLLDPGAAGELEGITAAVTGGATESIALRPREFRRFSGLRPVEGWRPIPNLDPEDVVLCVLRLDDERIVLGTQQGIAILMSDAGAFLESWNEEDGLTGGGIRVMRRDGQGGLWLGTDAGLARVQVDSQERHIAPERGLRAPVLCMHRHLGKLWAGTAAGAWREKDDRTFERQSNLPIAVWGFCSDADDLIIAGRSLMVLRPDGTTQRISVPAGFAALGNPEIDQSKQVLVVPASGSVLQYRREGGNWVRSPNVPGLNGSAYDLQFGPEGDLWVADSRSRVLRVPWRNGEGPIGAPFPVALPEARSSDPQEIRFAIWKGQLFATSNAGLARWNADVNGFQLAEELGPFARRRVTGLDTSRDGALWVFCTLGSDAGQSRRAWRVVLMDSGSGRVTEVTEYPADQIMPGMAYGIFADDRDHLFLYGEGPVGVVDADGAKGPIRIPPPVRIRRLRTPSSSEFAGGEHDAKQPVLLPLGEREVALEFAVPWFPTDSLNQSPISFRSRLSSGPQGWSTWSKERKRHFTNLPPGTYRFEAQASLTQSPGSAPVGALTFRIPPYWWETLAARVGFALAAIAVISIVARSLAQLRLRQKVAVLERAARMENERLRIARDMHDDLGSSLSLIAVTAHRLRNEATTPRIQELADHIQQSAAEVVKSARDIIWSVNPQNDTLDSLADYLASWVQRALEDAGVDCSLDIARDLPDAIVEGPVRNGLLMATKEAVCNLVKHARSRRAFYRIRVEGGEVAFTLRDQGQGLREGNTPVPGGGIGLSSMSTRLRSLGGSASIQTETGSGASVTFRLPLVRRDGKLTLEKALAEPKVVECRRPQGSASRLAEDREDMGSDAAGLENGPSR